MFGGQGREPNLPRHKPAQTQIRPENGQGQSQPRRTSLGQSQRCMPARIYVFVSDGTLQAEEQNNYIKFYLIEKNGLIELNELSEESLEYNSLNSRRHMGN
jgi:hypothetical protein